MKRALLALLIALVLAPGCGTPGQGESPKRGDPLATGIEIIGMEIHNSLEATIYDVMVLVPATGGFVSCGQILARTSCSTSFPQHEYQGFPVKVSWRGREGTTGTPEQALELDARLQKGMRAVVKVVVLSGGLAATLLEPATAPRQR